MFVELVSALRCPVPHEDSWLVAASERMAGRSIVEGVLGCPVCRAEYAIHDGVALFDATVGTPANATATRPVDADEVLRLAALLGLGEAGGIVILGGSWDACAVTLTAFTDARLLLVDATAPIAPSEQLSAIRAGLVFPVARAAARAIALDEQTASPERLASAVRVLRAGGRLVAPASCAVPAGVTELARDDRHWVAERDRDAIASAPIALRRA